MSEEVLGIIWVMRLIWMQWVLEVLVITPSRVHVARAGKRWTDAAAYGATDVSSAVGAIATAAIEEHRVKKKIGKSEELLKEDLEEFLMADKHNFSISNSEIIKVELKKGLAGVKFNIITNKKKFKWYAKSLGLTPPSIKTTGPEAKSILLALEDFHSILQPVFGDKLSVKK